MFQPTVLLLLLLFFHKNVVCQGSDPTGGEFDFNGFLYAAGSANLNNNGLFRLTNSTTQTAGQVFYNFPVRFKDSVNGTVYSFSTTFVFAIVSHYGAMKGHGLAFVICPTRAVELDTVQGPEVYDMNANHVGIDINTIVSEIAASAGYYKDDGRFIDLLLASGDPMQVWIEYDSKQRQLNVTLHPIRVPKPKIPLLSLQKDLSPYLLEFMYLGFSSSTGTLTASHYILGWTFKINGTAPAIDPSRLPNVPRFNQPWIRSLKGVLTISLTISGVAILIILGLSIWFFLKRKKLLEVLEDWEVQFGPHRFAFKDLHTATKGFKNTELLGKGGFGKVYKGTLPVSNVEIAVKRVSHDSRQGMRGFIAEIATIGRIRHPNLVRLQGYCRHKGELYLVYDCMPKGSLDKFLYDQQTGNLDWSQRFKIIKDVASGLCFLHQQWVQVIIHRDIKPANILLNANMNAKLGDFGLAKLWIMGLILRPLMWQVHLVIFHLSSQEQERQENGDIMQVLDHKIGQDYVEEQVAFVLKLGLLCSHPVPAIRPNMSSVIQFLDSVAQLPDNLLDIVQTREIHRGTEISGGAADSPESSSVAPLTFTESFVSHGR
ncbi:unnamed protein product [Arabidopsis lyrata]|nr:unnamed protein product [Arabidopsis lyrata]